MQGLMKRFLVAGSVALLVTACGGGGSGGNGGGGSSPPPVPVASIQVEPGELALNRGEQRQLAAIVKDGNGNVLQGRAVTWASADAQKVSVTASGLVQAVGAGRTSIVATVEGKSAATRVLVVDPAAPVSRVRLDVVNAEVEEGDRLQLTATPYDADGNVLTGRGQQWTSSNPGVASVSALGEVTALRPGVVTVTVRIDGGQAEGTVRVFADYDYELIFSQGQVEQPEALFKVDINDPAAVAMPVFGPGRYASHAAPSPDGSRIAFVVHRQVDSTDWQSQIFVADRDGSNAVAIVTLPAVNEQPAWSRDGSRIAFRSRAVGQGVHIWAVDPDGSNLVNLTADDPDAAHASPAWSGRLVDGTYRIAYARAQGGSSQLWTMLPDGSGKRQVTSNVNYWDDEPAWSPDGRRLVFTRSGIAIFGDLYLVSSGGGEGSALIPWLPLPYGQFSPTWSPDGELIAFTSKHLDGETYKVWTVRADGTRLAQRTFEPGQHADPAWIRRP
jgi:dipeptidyl aminopeptidase/acylaminoacyl peptidase